MCVLEAYHWTCIEFQHNLKSHSTGYHVTFASMPSLFDDSETVENLDIASKHGNLKNALQKPAADGLRFKT